MTMKEQLHELVDALDESDEQSALRYLARLTARVNGSFQTGARANDVGDPIVADVPIDPSSGSDADEWISRGRPFSMDSPLWDLVGSADSGPDGPTDVSTNKHEYL